MSGRGLGKGIPRDECNYQNDEFFRRCGERVYGPGFPNSGGVTIKPLDESEKRWRKFQYKSK